MNSFAPLKCINDNGNTTAFHRFVVHEYIILDGYKSGKFNTLQYNYIHMCHSLNWVGRVNNGSKICTFRRGRKFSLGSYFPNQTQKIWDVILYFTIYYNYTIIYFTISLIILASRESSFTFLNSSSVLIGRFIPSGASIGSCSSTQLTVTISKTNASVSCPSALSGYFLTLRFL